MRRTTAILMMTILTALLLAALTACGADAPPPQQEPEPPTGSVSASEPASEPETSAPPPASADLPGNEAGPAEPAGPAGATARDRTGTAAIGEPGEHPALAEAGDPGITEDTKTAMMEPTGTAAPQAGMTASSVTADVRDGGAPGSSPHPGHEGLGGELLDRSPHRPETALKAGEVDDNDRWQEYLDFVDKYEGPTVHETDLSHRMVVSVTDRNGNTVPNATVTLNHEGRELARQLTYADGRTILFLNQGENPGMRMMRQDRRDGGYTITVSRDGFRKELTPGAVDQDEIQAVLAGAMDYGSQVPLDVMFLLDSTGSMSDEINQIKRTLQSISKQVAQLPGNPDLRFGMVSYRDRGDEYVTRLYDFDGNVERFRKSIQEVRANGGDDYPESLNQAIHEAVNDAGWRDDAVRLVFLIADAPPHLDYSQDEDYAAEMVQARRKGIKIFSVASSGLDQQGEYVFRQIAQQTMGKFLFILYSTGTQGELTTPHDVEQYSVNWLDDLIVRLIQDELAALGQAATEGTGMELK